MAQRKSKKKASTKRSPTRKKKTASKKQASVSTPKKGGTGKNGKNGKRPTPKPSRDYSLLILLLVLAALLVGVFFLLQYMKGQERPAPASYKLVYDELVNQNVSPVIAADLAHSYVSGNYTFAELEAAYPGFEADLRAVDERLRQSSTEVLAVVNDFVITREDLSQQYALLPTNYQESLTEAEVLEQMINEELLLQAGKRLGVTATPEAIEKDYQALLSNSNLTEAQLLENIKTYGLSLEELKVLLARQRTINNVFTTVVNDSFVVDPASVRAYYDAHPEEFTKQPQVTVRHILIAVAPEKQEDSKMHALAKDLLRQITEEDADFCTLVEKYTNDAGSKANCGEYTFSRGVMVPEFEAASFAMKVGDTSLIKSKFGYHIIQKLSENPGGLVSFDEVAPTLEQQLANQQRLLAYSDYIKSLRANATVVNYMNMSDEGVPEDATTASDDEAPVIVNATVVENETLVANTTNDVATSVAIVKGDTSTTNESTEPVGDLASCLSGKEVTLYIADWAPASTQEAVRYGTLVPVVDCSTAACKGIDMFPAWSVNGELHFGSLSESELASLAGC